MRLSHSISLVLLAILGTSPSLRAQGVIVADHVRDVDGMRGAVVLTTFSDSTGRVWIGTDAGLNVFGTAGVHPVEVGRELVLVSVIAEQPKGVIWVGHSQGLGRLRGSDYEEIEFPAIEDVPPGGLRTVALVPDGDRTVLVGTQGGLYRVGPSGPARPIPIAVEAPWQSSARQVFSLLPTRSLGTLVGTAAGTFTLGADDQAEFLFRTAGLDVTNEMRALRAMLELPDGRIAVAGRLGTCLFDPLTRGLENLPGAAVQETVTMTLAPAADGGFWGCSPWSGFWRWSPASQTIQRFDLRSRNSDLRDGPTLAFGVRRSNDGILWVATPNGLLFFAEEPQLPLMFVPRDNNGDGRTRVHVAIPDDDGSIWLATGADGLQRISSSGALLRVPSAPFEIDGVEVLHREAPGQLLALTRSMKILRISVKSVEAVPLTGLSLPSDARLVDVFPRRSGALVVMTDTGLFELPPTGAGTELRRTADFPFARGLGVAPLSVVEDDRGDLWILTSGGTLRIDSSGRNHRYGQSNPDTVEVKVPGDQAMAALDLGSGRMLLTIAGRPGILDVDAGTYEQVALRHPTGRQVGFIHDILRDQDGRLWGLTSSTALRIDLDDQTALECRVSLARSNAILSHLCEGPGGHLIVTSGDGLVMFDPSEASRATLPPDPCLREVSILGDSQPVLDAPGLRVLPDDHNRLSFAVSSNDYLNRDRLRYSMRLVGAADDWQDVGRDGRIHYAGLAPGAYRLEARAENGGGVWTEPVTLYRFVLEPPLWRTLPFQLGVGLFLGLLAILGFRRQVGLERRRSEALERVVAERTESLRTKSEELERLYNVVRDINAATTLEDLFKTTLGESIAALEADAGRFYLRSEDSWKLAIAVGWAPVAGATPSAALLDKLGGASLERPIEQVLEWPDDVVLPVSGTTRETCSLMMHLGDEGNMEACMMIDFHHRMGPADDMHLTLVERLYQPVTLAYRKLRLLETAEKLNDRKNELLGAAAHDLRNPITVIGMTVEMMRTEVERDVLPGKARENSLREVSLIAKATRRMAAMVDKLLDISAIESGRVEIELSDQDLGAVVRDRVGFFERLAASRRIGLAFEGDDGVAMVRADPERIGTALDNLLSNALKYTASDGSVVVSCRCSDREVIVQVRDDGQGLPPQDTADLFTRFRRMSARPAHGEVASGLGLAIVKRIVELHGGRVFAGSELGRGSTFGFALPLRREPDPL